jgi:hypothetical protein
MADFRLFFLISGVCAFLNRLKTFCCGKGRLFSVIFIPSKWTRFWHGSILSLKPQVVVCVAQVKQPYGAVSVVLISHPADGKTSLKHDVSLMYKLLTNV